MGNEYTIKPKSTSEYEVYKFEEGDDVPVGFYTVKANNGKLECNCMSGHYRGYCKHSKFVREYRRKERAGTTLEGLMIFMKGGSE